MNHGSYGACPLVVLQEQDELRRQMEGSLVCFMSVSYPKLLDEVRQELAEFLTCRPQDLAFVQNATSGVNAVLRSLDWKNGDEVLLSDHTYNACHNVLRYLEQRYSLKLVVVELSFPQPDWNEYVNRVCAAVSSRTRLALFDHIASPTALIFPVKHLARELANRGVDVLIDGAHAPGMLELSLNELESTGVSYYTGNFHKWCCAPKGSAFLWVEESKQEFIHPPVIGHGFNSEGGRSRFLEEFDWSGTFDPTAWLATPKALRFLSELYEGGWGELRQTCRDLLWQGAELVLKNLPQQQTARPLDTGQILSLVLPHSVDIPDWYQKTYEDYGLDLMLTEWNQQKLLRISAAPYNELRDYELLAQALESLL